LGKNHRTGEGKQGEKRDGGREASTEKEGVEGKSGKGSSFPQNEKKWKR